MNQHIFNLNHPWQVEEWTVKDKEVIGDDYQVQPGEYITGFYFSEAEPKPRKELIDFIEAGVAPVVITLGSTKHKNPHQWLFPRASCVIHHGGVGN